MAKSKHTRDERKTKKAEAERIFLEHVETVIDLDAPIVSISGDVPIVRISDADEDTCQSCDSTPYGGEGCPDCLPCAGEYAPGTEECDWCKYQNECEEYG